jgi:ribosomal protein L33
MAKRNDLRPNRELRSTAGTGFTYVTRKNGGGTIPTGS